MPEATSRASLKTGRSPVYAAEGMVATSQPLAAGAALEILREGGSAADAAVCAASMLNVVEPQSTGIGGDMFMLYWDAGEKELFGLNGSGRAPRRATPERYREAGFETVPEQGIFSVTVPGAVDGWAAALERFGSDMGLAKVLAPAIRYAEKGYPVSPIIASAWKGQEPKLRDFENSARVYLPAGRAVRAGEIFRNPELAASLRLVADDGPRAFYEGPIAAAIVKTSGELDGLLEMEDLAATKHSWVDPIRTDYRGVELCEIPPNGQGLTALICLNILEGFPLGEISFGCADHLHFLIESLKLAFADKDQYIADPEKAEVPVEALLSKNYAESRRGLIRPTAVDHPPGVPSGGSDTVYLTTADKEGNMCSFINSLFSHFGSGVTVGNTGFVLQNRGAGFVLNEAHPNCIAPGKRPFHTIIPGFVMRDSEPWMSFGVMGGDMQPQGHAQVLSNMVDFGMNVQEAIDAPRLRILGGLTVNIEMGVPAQVIESLLKRGHDVTGSRGFEGCGGGQGIVQLPEGVYMAGSDHRRDGCAVGY